jgi:hypothetical protein
MGRIVDVIVDRSGTVRAAVIDLRISRRRQPQIVVDWSALHFGQVTNKKESSTLELTQDQVKAAPEYKEDTSIVVPAPPAACNPAIRSLSAETSPVCALAPKAGFCQ